MLDKYYDVIVDKLKISGITYIGIYKLLVDRYSYKGSYSLLKTYIMSVDEKDVEKEIIAKRTNKNDKALRKRIDSLVPRSNEANVADFLDTT